MNKQAKGLKPAKPAKPAPAPAPAAIPPVETPPPSAKERKRQLQASAAETRAALGDLSTLRKKGGKTLSLEAASMLQLALAGRKEKTWKLKGGAEAIQTSGLVAPIEFGPEDTPEAKGRAIALNQALAPWTGYHLRVVAFVGGKRGLSISAFLALSGR